MLLRLRWRLPSRVGEADPCPLLTMMPGERRSWSCGGEAGTFVMKTYSTLGSIYLAMMEKKVYIAQIIVVQNILRKNLEA